MKLLYILLISLAFSSAAFAEVVVPVQLEFDFHVEPGIVDGKDVEILHMPDGEKIEIPVDLNIAEIKASGFSAEDIGQVRFAAREQLELALEAMYSDQFSGMMAISANGEAASLEPAKLSLRQRTLNVLKKIYQEDQTLKQPLPEGANVLKRTTRVARYVYQFVIAETIRALKAYGSDWWKAKSRFVEYGFSIDFKFEPQVFIAKYNPTSKYRALRRNYEFIYDISYNLSTHNMIVHRRLRREKGTGGLGLPALKAEFKTYQSDGTNEPIRGKSLYPIAPPIASLVLDSSPHYFAQGVSFGVNSGEVIPGSTLTNTFVDFAQGTRIVTETPHRKPDPFVTKAIAGFRKMLDRFRKTCSALLEPESKP